MNSSFLKRSPKHSSRLGAPACGLLTAYSAMLAGAVVLASPWWLPGLRRGGKYREGFAERLGRIPHRRLRPASGQTIWVHAVSVGEVLAVAPLVVQLQLALPRSRVFVSTTTRTGQAIARARFGEDSVFYFPADFAFAVCAWLRYLQPRLLLLVESEFWPRVLYEADRARVPVAVVNARISSRSWPRYRRLRWLWRPLLGTLALAQAQTHDDAERLRHLGVRNVTVGGNLKYDVQPAPATPLLGLLQAALPSGADVLVCGSTLAGEEELLLRAVPPGPVLLLAPRHPERFDEAAALLQASGRRWQRLSAWRHDPRPIEPGSVLLLDSVGELAALYALATVAIVGGGFLHAGGHNPLEPAAHGKPVVIGTGYANFTGIVSTLQAAQAIEIVETTELRDQLEQMLAQPHKAEAMGARARQVWMEQGGATARAVSALLGLLMEGAHGGDGGVHPMRHSPWQSLLLPLQLPYRVALEAKNTAYRRGWLQPALLGWPVVSVGNLSVGGAGKTPVVIELARLLRERGVHVDVLSRGYGRRSPQPVERVEADGSARRFGDEPLLIARATDAPVYVGASRWSAGKLAEQQAGARPGVHLLDDGFQHRRLARAVDIVVVHPGDVRDRLLPAGRLREPLSALRRADFLVLREDDALSEEALGNAGIHKPVWRVRRILALPPVGGEAFAFCGIAHPNEFFGALRSGGIALRGTLAFRDHHAFTQADIERIAERAHGAGALLTTEKDLVRLGARQREQLARAAPLHAVPLRVEILDADRCLSALPGLLA